MREFIQTKLIELEEIDIGTEIPDDMLEKGTTYFSYSLYENLQNADYDNNYEYNVLCIGFVKRLIKASEDTLQIVDTAVDKIVDKLREINIRCSFEDVSIENGVQKVKITGKCSYNEINNKLI